jgi:hypothetical protein
MVPLPAMSPAQEQGWRVLLDLGTVLPDGWCLIGGQMVWLFAAEHGVDPPRATDDVDVVIDLRSRPARPCPSATGVVVRSGAQVVGGIGYGSGTPPSSSCSVRQPDLWEGGAQLPSMTVARRWGALSCRR